MLFCDSYRRSYIHKLIQTYKQDNGKNFPHSCTNVSAINYVAFISASNCFIVIFEYVSVHFILNMFISCISDLWFRQLILCSRLTKLCKLTLLLIVVIYKTSNNYEPLRIFFEIPKIKFIAIIIF